MKIGIGTVQFGLDYGISNTQGQTPETEVQSIFAICKQNNVDVIDTAYAYGNSETVVGKNLPPQHSFRIFSKTPPLKKTEIKKEDCQFWYDSFIASLEKLKQTRIAGLYVHHIDDLFSPGGEKLYQCLQDLKCSKKVDKIGVSIYTAKQIENVLSHFDIDIIQIPINVLDQRLEVTGLLQKLKKRNIEIHARSVFLQGLLLLPIEKISSYFQPIMPVLKEYHSFLKEHDLSLVSGCFCFLQQLSSIDYVIMGVNDKKQFLDNIASFQETLQNGKSLDFSKFAISEEQFINPSLWKNP